MRVRRHPDTWLSRLSAVTGIAAKDDLLELGRFVEDIVEAADDKVLLADWTGHHHAIAVVDGLVFRESAARSYRAGEVFISNPLETVRSHGAIALIARPKDASRLAALLADRRRTDVESARPERRSTGVLLERMRQPSGRPCHREDDLARARHHAAHLT